jgi:site-specific recombinase XerD
MAMGKTVSTWAGGRKVGDTYRIEKMVAGKRYNLTLGVRSHAEALEALSTFHRDPGAFSAAHRDMKTAKREKSTVKAWGPYEGHLEPQKGTPTATNTNTTTTAPTPTAPTVLSVTRFELPPISGGVLPPKVDSGLSESNLSAWKEDAERAGLTPRYIKNTLTVLRRWRESLKKPLLSHTAKELHSVLGTLPAQKQHVIALKSFCGWLTRTFRAENDPSLALKVPQARRAAKTKGYSQELIEKTYSLINGPTSRTRPVKDYTAQGVRDVYVLAALHGLHYTEIKRIATAGDTDLRKVEHTEIAGVVRFLHKNGDVHFLSIGQQALNAALRLRKHGIPADTCVSKYLRLTDTGVSLGQLRHSFVTIAGQSARKVHFKDEGASLEDIAAITGHKSVSTTARFYSNVQTPAMLVIPLKLIHPDDP